MAQEVTALRLEENAMILERELVFRGSRGSEKLITLFDSGSMYSCISPEKLRLWNDRCLCLNRLMLKPQALASLSR
jgi:hypothetical protein